MIIVLFGQPYSGKTTLAMGIEKRFMYTHNIDGDDFRLIFKDTDYSKAGEVANLKKAVDCGYYTIATGLCVNLVYSMDFSYKEARDYLRELMPDAVFVYLHCNMPRGKEKNEIEDFDVPTQQEAVYLNTQQLTIDECLHKIVQAVAQKNQIRSNLHTTH